MWLICYNNLVIIKIYYIYVVFLFYLAYIDQKFLLIHQNIFLVLLYHVYHHIVQHCHNQSHYILLIIYHNVLILYNTIHCTKIPFVLSLFRHNIYYNYKLNCVVWSICIPFYVYVLYDSDFILHTFPLPFRCQKKPNQQTLTTCTVYCKQCNHLALLPVFIVNFIHILELYHVPNAYRSFSFRMIGCSFCSNTSSQSSSNNVCVQNNRVVHEYTKQIIGLISDNQQPISLYTH